MKNIIPFSYGQAKVSVILDDGKNPWWIAKEVCMILGLTDASKAVERLDADEKLIRKVFVSGQNRDIWTVNEPGLYSLIIRSNKPEAHKFKRWITHEVLPSIRKTGHYAVGQVSELDLIIKSAQAMKQIEARQVEHDQRLAVLEAKQHTNSGDTGYWTITAWCRLNSLVLSMEEAKRRGRRAVGLSAQWGVPVSKVPDERFGEVNSYREDVLEEVFDPV